MIDVLAGAAFDCVKRNVRILQYRIYYRLSIKL